jgi:hypothetical protein
MALLQRKLHFEGTYEKVEDEEEEVYETVAGNAHC